MICFQECRGFQTYLGLNSTPSPLQLEFAAPLPLGFKCMLLCKGMTLVVKQPIKQHNVKFQHWANPARYIWSFPRRRRCMRMKSWLSLPSWTLLGISVWLSEQVFKSVIGFQKQTRNPQWWCWQHSLFVIQYLYYNNTRLHVDKTRFSAREWQ